MLHAFYNKEYVGDILLCRLNDKKTTRYEKYNDMIVLFDGDEVIGFNILNASNYFEINEVGLVTITADIVDQINELLPSSIEKIEADLTDKFVVGYVTERKSHPDSDHLNVCQVDLGGGISTQIVCGASNVDSNMKVVVATNGAVMKSGLLIKPSTLRKINSNGMICSARELCLPNSEGTKGILVLDDSYEIGKSFFEQYNQRGN